MGNVKVFEAFPWVPIGQILTSVITIIRNFTALLAADDFLKILNEKMELHHA